MSLGPYRNYKISNIEAMPACNLGEPPYNHKR